MGVLDIAYKEKEKKYLKVKNSALTEAVKIAKILCKKFGATKVMLYGSLAKNKGSFDMASDIDLAVKGLGDRYLKAYGYCLRQSEFDLDVKAYEDMPLHFKQKVDKEGRLLCEK